MWFDLSPLRPDEYGKQVAATWERTEQVQGAFSKGKRLEKAKRQHSADSKKRNGATTEKLKGQV